MAVSTPGNTTVIQASNLTKSYGRQPALRGVDLQVNRGELHGFIGPNGAGKTTTIRILLGLLRIDSGQVRLFGADPWRDAVTLHRRLVYVPGDVTLWPDLTGGEVIDLLGRLHGRIDPARRQSLIARFQLDPSKKCRTYSKGNRQKVAIIAALAADAELLILDEPTSGLDPLMTATFHDALDAARRAGKTIFLSSHILSEVEAICDHISIIRRGQIVESGALSQLRHLTRTIVTVETSDPATDLEQLPGISDVTCEGNTWRFAVDTTVLPSVMQALAPLGVTSLTAQPTTLAELFTRHYVDDFQQEEAQVEEA